MSERLLPGPVRVRVPATSANLGPGYDCLGLALSRHDEVRMRVVDGPTRVTVRGEGAGVVPTDAEHLVARTALRTLAALDARPAGLALECTNRIPQARGLGSSSAAIVAGVLAARALLPGGAAALDDDAVLRLAAEEEGHPDNVAACLAGGLTIAWGDADGARAVRLEPDDTLRPVALVPAEPGLTVAARAALPEAVPHADAAANAARAALLVPALTGHPSLLLAATDDRLHQRYRAAGMPESMSLVEGLRAAGVPAVLSGAGPTVLALVGAGARLPAEVLARFGDRFATLPLTVDRQGATVWG